MIDKEWLKGLKLNQEVRVCWLADDDTPKRTLARIVDVTKTSMTCIEAMKAAQKNPRIGAHPIEQDWVLVFTGFGWGKRYLDKKASTVRFHEPVYGASLWPNQILVEWTTVEIKP